MIFVIRALAISLLAGSLMLAAETNLLTNGSFELPVVEGKMPGWSFPADKSRLAPDASDGEKSLEFNGVIGQWNLRLPQGTYELKFSLKKDCTNVLGVRLICYNAANQEIPGGGVSFYVAEGKRLGVWTEFQRVVRIPAETRRSALVFHTHNGVMLLDHIRLNAGQPGADGELVFSDDFSRTELGEDWMAVSGEWQLIDGELFAPVNYKEALLKFTGKVGKNLRLEYDCRSAAPNDLSAVLGCQPDTDTKEGYVFGFGASYNSYNYIAKANPFSIMARTIQEGFNTGIMPGKTHHIIVEKRDGMLKFYRDGQLELSTDDLFSDEETGESFALLTYNLGWYDNIKVYRLPESPRKIQAAERKVEQIQVYDFTTSSEPLQHDGQRIEIATWDYEQAPSQAQIMVQDPCLECSTALFALPDVLSGIIEFDLFTAEAAEVKISLENEHGEQVAALLIGKDGIFRADGDSGIVQLTDKIEYRRRLLYDKLAFVPGQWQTFRIKYDLENQLIDNLALLDLYTEVKGGTDKNLEINQGNYVSLGGRIPFKKQGGSVSKLRFQASEGKKLLLDNVLLFGPVGFKSVNGKNILFPGRELLSIRLQLRRDPMTLKRQSLRHFTRKEYAYRTPVMNEYRLGGGNPAFQLWAREYNEAMLRTALLQEKLNLLQRRKFYQAEADNVFSLADAWRQFAGIEQQQGKTVKAFADAFWSNCDEGLLEGSARQELTVFAGMLQALEEKLSPCFTTRAIPSQPIYSDWVFDYNAEQKRWYRNGQAEAFFLSGQCGGGAKPENAGHILDKLRALGFQPAINSFNWFNGGSPEDGEFFSRKAFEKTLENSRELVRLHKLAPFTSAWLQYGTGQIRFPVPLWWLEAHQDDPDIFHYKPDGTDGRVATPIYRGWPKFPFLTMNFWNPSVSAYLAERMRLGGEAMGQHPDVFGNTIFHLGGEASITLPGGMYPGYAPSAVQAFQKHLQTKYGTLAQLNRTWKSNYNEFAAIKPPPPGVEPSPLRYEFQTFVHADYFNHFIRIGKENLEKGFGRSLPIGHDFQDTFSEFDMPAFYDNTSIVLFHSYQIWDRKIYPKYLQSLAQATGTPWGAMEWGSSQGSKTMFDLEEIRLHAIREISHQLQWGCVAPNLFSDFLAGPSDWQYGMPLADYRVGHLLFNYHASYYRICKERGIRLGNVALTGQLVPADVAVLEVDSARRNALPDRAVYAMCKDFAMEMEKQNAHYSFLYEKLLLDGRQQLNDIPMVFVPNGICMPDQLDQLLADYLQQGGIVIAFAPPGVFNELGLPGAQHVLQKAFPGETWQHRNYASWQAENWAAETLQGALMYRGQVGKGVLYVFPSPNNFEHARSAFLHLLKQHINPRIRTDQPEFQFSYWEKDQSRYLYVLNYDIKGRQNGKVSVQGKYRIEDLDLPGQQTIPVEYNNGRSEFSTSLAPAEMTLFQLIPIP